MVNNLEIGSEDFLELCKSKGIKVGNMGWNQSKRKLGYSKTTPTARGEHVSFHYFDINEENIITNCPRGFTKLRGCRIRNFDNLVLLVNA